MSVSFGCKCAERKKPPEDRNWVIRHHKHHHSAFAGYRWTPSDYSFVECLSCGKMGHTKAKYVRFLKIVEFGEN